MASLFRKTTKEFIKEAKIMHKGRYDYSKVIYQTAKDNVVIICPTHGEYFQTPDTHLRSGCRECANEALPGAYTKNRFLEDLKLANQDGYFYYVRFKGESEEFFKVGVTKNKICSRFGNINSYGYKMEIIYIQKMKLSRAFEIEQIILKKLLLKHKYVPLNKNQIGRRFGGRTECFKQPLSKHQLSLIDNNLFKFKDL